MTSFDSSPGCAPPSRSRCSSQTAISAKGRSALPKRASWRGTKIGRRSARTVWSSSALGHFEVLKRHLALRARLVLAGKIQHDYLFFKEDGSPIGNLQYPWVRWRRTLRALKARYRDPYNARHSSVSWNLMVGKNPLWVAKQHGHSVQTMLEVYAAWTEGAKESDVEAIRRAMESRPREVVLPSVAMPRKPLIPPRTPTPIPWRPPDLPPIRHQSTRGRA